MPVRSLTLLAVFLVAGTVAVHADPRADVLAAAARCNAIADYHVWLNCYYGAAQPMRGLLGLPPAGAAQVNLVPPARPDAPTSAALPAARRSPGNTAAADPDYAPPQRLAAYSFDKQGLFTVTLADGGVWKQIEQDNLTARWRAPAASYTASVVPGLFGSHLLRVSDGHSYRVDRAR